MALGKPQTIGSLANNIASNFEDVGKLMIGVAYLSGIGFGIAAVFKFKQVKDNPTQIPIGTRPWPNKETVITKSLHSEIAS